MTSRIKKLLLATALIFYVIFLTGTIALKHPFISLPGTDPAPIAQWYMDGYERIGALRPERFSAATPPATFTYRENNARTGEHRGSYVQLPLKIDWFSEDINVGIHSASKSSPAVDDSGIYVGGDTGWIHAFDHSGKEMWKFHTGQAHRGIHGTAVLDPEFVFIGSYNGRLYSLRKTDGSLVWMRVLADAIGSSPLLWKDSILSTSETAYGFWNGSLARLNRIDGAYQWRGMSALEQVHSSPAIDESKNFAVFGANNGRILASGLVTAQTKWVSYVAGPVKSTPAIHNGLVYVSSWSEELVALNLDDGTVTWRADLGGRSQSSPTLITEENIVVVGAGGFQKPGSLRAYNMTTGREVWTIDLPANAAPMMGSAVAVRSSPKSPWFLLSPCERGNICAISARDGKVLQRIDLGDRLITTVPSVHKGSVYVALDDGGVVKLVSDRTQR
jgi:outer membrane protein assembly factor BamB